MSIASKIGTIVGTTAAYAVHYAGKISTPLGVLSMVYANKKEIKEFAVKHALDKNSPDAVQNNLLECLEYID
jgi:hypothetical protein